MVVFVSSFSYFKFNSRCGELNVCKDGESTRDEERL